MWKGGPAEGESHNLGEHSYSEYQRSLTSFFLYLRVCLLIGPPGGMIVPAAISTSILAMDFGKYYSILRCMPPFAINSFVSDCIQDRFNIISFQRERGQ